MKRSISSKELRNFGLLIGFCFPIFVGWFLSSIGGHDFRIWTLFIGIPCLLLGITKPILLLYPYKAWMKLGHVLGWINSRVILGLVFLLMLLPISIIMKFFQYDPLRKNWNNKKSYKENIKNKEINMNRIF